MREIVKLGCFGLFWPAQIGGGSERPGSWVTCARNFFFLCARMSSSRRVARRPKLAKVPSFGKSVRDISQIPHDSKKRAENPSNNSKNSKRLRFDKKTSEIHAYCARAAVSSSLPAAASQRQPSCSSLPAAASRHQLHSRSTQKPQDCRRTLSQQGSNSLNVAHGNSHSSSTAIPLQPHDSSSTAASPQQRSSSSCFNRKPRSNSLTVAYGNPHSSSTAIPLQRLGDVLVFSHIFFGKLT